MVTQKRSKTVLVLLNGILAIGLALSLPSASLADQPAGEAQDTQADYWTYVPVVMRDLLNVVTGILDPEFDVDGKVTTNFAGDDDYAYAVAIQPDGKVVVAGYTVGAIYNFALVRYNSDGSLDTTFDSDGKVVTEFGSHSLGRAVAIQPDGKIVVAGYVYNATVDLALARYNPDGSLDTSFDGDGMAVTDIAGKSDRGFAIALQPDGKIVVAGYTTGLTDDFALARYNPDGSLDTSFDGDGKVVTDFEGVNDQAFAVTLQTDGKIVVIGEAYMDYALARYNTDGSLDTTFDGDGKVITDYYMLANYGRDVVIQPDGKIVAAGHASVNGDFDFMLARYNLDGSLDLSFGSEGLVVTDLADDDDFGETVALESDGKIIVAGRTYGATSDFGLVRYNTDGSQDYDFGTNGQVVTDIAGGDDYAMALTLQAGGKIVLVGYGDNGTYLDFAVTQYR